MKPEKEKILFKYFSNVLDELTIETIWTEVIDRKKGLFKVDNIPFYGPLVAPDDIIFAEFDTSEGMLTFREVTEYSGNSVVLVIILTDEIEQAIIRDKFSELNCISEGINDKYFSMEIKEETNYSTVKKVLDDYENSHIINYAEPCLSDKHASEVKQN